MTPKQQSLTEMFRKLAEQRDEMGLGKMAVHLSRRDGERLWREYDALRIVPSHMPASLVQQPGNLFGIWVRWGNDDP